MGKSIYAGGQSGGCFADGGMNAGKKKWRLIFGHARHGGDRCHRRRHEYAFRRSGAIGLLHRQRFLHGPDEKLIRAKSPRFTTQWSNSFFSATERAYGERELETRIAIRPSIGRTSRSIGRSRRRRQPHRLEISRLGGCRERTHEGLHPAGQNPPLRPIRQSA